MWSRWWSAGGGVGLLKQRVSGIFNLGHGYGGKVQPFHPTLLGLSDIAVECDVRQAGVGSLSVMLSEIRRGICSSTWVSSPADSNGSPNFSGNGSLNNGNRTEESITFCEAKKLMRLLNVEALKMKLAKEGKEVILYSELLHVCESMGVARNSDEATAFAKVLDEAGVILLFRDKVYLHPDKVVELVRRAVPLALTADDDAVRDELKKLQEKKQEIDVLAHKQVRRILWSGLGFAVLQLGLFFRLTFWEFSWDVMEPVAFFTTTTGLVIGYAYFLFTSRDPTYQDLMKRLFLSRQRKLIKRHNFDVERFVQLQKLCKSPLDARTNLKNHVGLELDLEDALHRH